jgi:glycosyltransferase involved in cell wall biosynthesis
MNILQMISSAGFYGAERMVIQLCLALEKQGCHTRLAVFRNEPRPNLEILANAREAGLTTVELPCAGRFDRSTIRQIQALARDFHADIVHSHGYKPNLYAWMALGTSGPRLVSTCHGYIDGTVALYMYGILDRRLLRRYYAISAVSERDLSRLLGSGVPASKIRVINNGIDCRTFAGAPPSIDRRGASFLIGSVGRMTPEKNPTGFLAAARHAVRSFPDAQFLFIGDGRERTRLELLAREWGLEQNVQFLGFRQDMPNVYASLDLLVLPSLDEGLPMAILECMAAGTPVIATRVGAVEKLVRNEETGLLLAPGDQEALNQAVVRLLSDRDLARRLGKAGQDLVNREFSSDAMARNYLDLYRSGGVAC